MKFKPKNILFILATAAFMSCGSSETVITEDGKVYEIKGSHYYNNGVKITDDLSLNEKKAIDKLLESKLEAKKASEERLERLKNEQNELEKQRKQAAEKQKKLEARQKKLEREQEAREKARKNFLDAKEKLKDQTERYERLKEKGKLSPRDEEKWQEKLKDLKEDLKKAELTYNNL